MAADPLTAYTTDDLLRAHEAFDTDDEDLAERPPLNAQRDDKAILSPRKRKAGNDLRDEIVDEEVKIVKQRRKIPKLDTDKLISEPGLPKIRGLLRTGELKKKLRLKGKGHEFSDAARLLNFYQMWLDNLYPRAKFADAVKMVEKAGHTKKMQMYRKSWIDEGKPGYLRRQEVDDALDAQEASTRPAQPEHQIVTEQDFGEDFDEDPSSMFFGGDDRPATEIQDGPDDDELEALLAQETRPTASAKQAVDADSEGEDDLDAFLAQAQTHRATSRMSQRKSTVQTSRQQLHPEENADGSPNNDEFDDLDDLLNDSAEKTEPELPSNRQNGFDDTSSRPHLPGSEEVPELENVVSSSPIPNVHTDELDQLLDEHDAVVEQRKKQADPDIVEEFFSSSPLQS